MKNSLRTLLGIGLATGWLGLTASAAEGQPTDTQVRQLYNLPPTNAAPPAPTPITGVSTTPVNPVDLAAAAQPEEPEELIKVLTFGPDVTLESAIKHLARQAGINIYVDASILPSTPGPDGKPVQPNPSVRWENVSARDALDELLDIYQLELTYNAKTKVFRVVKKSTEVPRFTYVYQLRFANPTNMVTVISNNFAGPSGAKAIHDTRTSQIIVNATEKDLNAVSNLLTQLDLPTKQVLIEAQIFETTKNPKTVKGIDWSGTLEAQKVTFGNGNTAFQSRTDIPGSTTSSSTPSGRPVSVTSAESTTSSALTQLDPAAGLIGFTANTARGWNPSVAFLNADGASAVLSFLNKEADSEVVATPRAVTMDNMPAVLEVTRSYPIFQITPGTAQTPAGSEVQYTNVGAILTVTPRISANNTVALQVVPEVSSIDSKDRQIVNGQVNEANVYAVRRIEASVLVPSGNTLVMGGLISDSSADAYTKVPILGDLPLIGLAFRHESKSRTKSNLLIFVTPTIVKETDYLPANSEFLKTRPPDKVEMPDSAWESGKPHDWKKPVP